MQGTCTPSKGHYNMSDTSESSSDTATLLQLVAPIQERTSSAAKSGATAGLSVSQALVVNRKLIDLACATCEGSLLVTVSGPVSDAYFRSKLQDMYNDLWDACLDASRVELNCVVLGTLSSAQKPFSVQEYLLQDARVSTVLTAGRSVDGNCLSEDDIAKINTERSKSGLKQIRSKCLEDHLTEELFGIEYTVFDNPSDPLPQFENVVMGGTFDHFHNGHKKLLSIACHVTTKRIVIGITGNEMLKSKSHGDLIEPFDVRSNRVIQFVKMMNSSLEVVVEMINDPFGPSIVFPDLQGVVVSSETLKGARLINEKRKAKGLSQLEAVVALRTNVYPLSSSFVREWKHRVSGSSL